MNLLAEQEYRDTDIENEHVDMGPGGDVEWVGGVALTYIQHGVFQRSVMSDSLWLTRLLCPWGFSRQECLSGSPSPPPGDLPNPGMEPRSPALQVDPLSSEPPGKPIYTLPYAKLIANGNLLISTGISTRCSLMTYMGGMRDPEGPRLRRYMSTYSWFTVVEQKPTQHCKATIPQFNKFVINLCKMSIKYFPSSITPSKFCSFFSSHPLHETPI